MRGNRHWEFVPLFDVLITDLRQAKDKESESAIDKLSRDAGLLYTLLSSYMWPHIRQAVQQEQNALFMSLKFLKATANDLQSIS
jgi:hypothetical protein